MGPTVASGALVHVIGRSPCPVRGFRHCAFLGILDSGCGRDLCSRRSRSRQLKYLKDRSASVVRARVLQSQYLAATLPSPAARMIICANGRKEAAGSQVLE